MNYSSEREIRNIVCEINIIPHNTQSLMFHKKFGFFEVGQQWLGNHEKKVSMQLCRL